MARHREADRLAALHQTGLMDTAPEAEFDTVAMVAATVLAAPMATVTLVDDHRQWFKARVGIDIEGGPRSESFCAVAIDQDAPLVVQDARTDPRFADWPLVRAGAVVSYAGVPVAGRDGLPLGTLCVLDVKPRRFEDAQIEVLKSLGRLIGDELDLRRRDHLAGIGPGHARQASRELLLAIDDDQLVVHYQPIVDLRTGGVRNVEALVRWNHPTRGLLPPEAFLPLAEVSGFAHRIDRYVMSTAVETIAELRTWTPRLDHLGVAVNLGLWPSVDMAWAADIADVLNDSGLPPEALTVEVSERSLDGASGTAREALETVAGLGCRLAVDDIGTGTSSLSRLAELPATEVKLDRSFVNLMGQDARRAAVVAAVARLGRELKLGVVAEGVETYDMARLAAGAGCGFGQGFYWSRPVDREELVDRLLDRSIPNLRQSS